MNKKNTTFLNSLYVDFLTENELDLYLKSLYEIWTAELYSKLKKNGLIRHVISKYGIKVNTGLLKFLNMKIKFLLKNVKVFLKKHSRPKIVLLLQSLFLRYLITEVLLYQIIKVIRI